MRSSETKQATTAWRRVLLGAALLAMALPVSGCAAHLTPAFFLCLFSTSSSADSCRIEALAPGPPAAPTGVGAGYLVRGIGDFLVHLNWSRSPEPDVRGYHVYRSATSGGPYHFVFGDVGPPTVDDLAWDEDVPDFGPCTTVYYVVRTVDWIHQESPDSGEASVATPCWGPPVPTGLTATPGERRVYLDWDDRNSPDLAGYDVYRGHLLPEESVALVKVNSLPVTASEYLDLELGNATEYFYRVAAVYHGSKSGRSGVVSATPDVSPRDYLRDLTATPRDASVRLEWDDSPAPPNVVGFNVYRGTKMLGSLTKLNGELVTDLEYVDTGLVNRTEYFYRVTVVFASGFESDPSAMVSATPFEAKPATLTGLTATVGDRSVRLDWDDTDTPGLAGYNVYRAEQATGSFAKVNSELVAASQFVVADLSNDTEYFFRITAVDISGGESDPSAVVSATPVGANEKPAAPTGLTATHSGEDVWLDWDDNGEADLAGYYVYEAKQAAGPFGRLDFVTASEYLVLETPNIEFFYYVTAVDKAGKESDPSAIVRAAPTPFALALPIRELTAASPDQGWFPFELTISADYREGGHSRVEDDRLAGEGFVYEGAFELKSASRLPAAGLGGTWRSTTDWVLEPGAGRGSATGIALATFTEPEAGQACLRFEETYTVKQSSKRAEVATRGTFTLLGGTGAAAKLLGKGTHRVSVDPDGSVRYDGKARAVQGAVPELPAACEALSTLP